MAGDAPRCVGTHPQSGLQAPVGPDRAVHCMMKLKSFLVRPRCLRTIRDPLVTPILSHEDMALVEVQVRHAPRFVPHQMTHGTMLPAQGKIATKGPESALDLFGRAESLLADNLGGRLERMTAERIPGSTAVVRYVGAKPTTAQR